MQVTLFGIKNCDTVKKAQRWLTLRGVDFTFHDLRTDGLEANMLNYWINCCGLPALINKRSTTYRNLDETQKKQLEHLTSALTLLKQQPTLIKRPILVYNTNIEIGFHAQRYQQILQ